MVSLNTHRMGVGVAEKEVREPGLLLTRRQGEAIFYTLPDGKVIEIWIKTVGANRVQIRSVAPDDVDIKRNELAGRAA